MDDLAPWFSTPDRRGSRALASWLRARQPLYALLDTARDPTVGEVLAASDCWRENLFTGERAERLAAYAPYLVQLGPDARLLDDLIPHWDAHWGVFLTSPAPAADLLAHLRELIWPDTPSGPMLWRCYDPRVLRAVLPTCDGRRAAAFFGPVQAFLCAGATPDRLLHCTCTADGVAVRAQAISALPRT